MGRDVTPRCARSRPCRPARMRYRIALHALALGDGAASARASVLDAKRRRGALFGYRDAEAMKGGNLLDHFSAPEQRQRCGAHRAVGIGSAPGEALPGDRLPPHRTRSTARLRGRGHRRWRSTAWPAGGAAEMYVDITARQERQAALAAFGGAAVAPVRHQPLTVMTLTDLETGRYALVNDCFLQVTGWRREEADRPHLHWNSASGSAGRPRRLRRGDCRQGGVQAMPVNPPAPARADASAAGLGARFASTASASW